MRTTLIALLCLIVSPAFAIDCQGKKLVILPSGATCEALSQSDLDQRAADEAAAPARQAERQAKEAERAASSPEALKAQIDALTAEIEALKAAK